MALAVTTGPANRRDETQVDDLLDALTRRTAPGRRGRPRTKPRELLGDAGYGFPHTIAAVRARRIRPLLKPRAKPGEQSVHGSGLGKRRYVVERTLSHFNHHRRLRLCYEKLPEHWQAFHDLAAALLTFNRLARLKGF